MEVFFADVITMMLIVHHKKYAHGPALWLFVFSLMLLLLISPWIASLSLWCNANRANMYIYSRAWLIQTFLLVQHPQICLLSAYIEYTRKLCSNPLAWLVVLIDADLAMAYAKPCYRCLHHMNPPCTNTITTTSHIHINGLVQERRNTSALALELCLSCSNPLICYGILCMIHEKAMISV